MIEDADIIGKDFLDWAQKKITIQLKHKKIHFVKIKIKNNFCSSKHTVKKVTRQITVKGKYLKNIYLVTYYILKIL